MRHTDDFICYSKEVDHTARVGVLMVLGLEDALKSNLQHCRQHTFYRLPGSSTGLLLPA
jgi:hypothetical protein